MKLLWPHTYANETSDKHASYLGAGVLVQKKVGKQVLLTVGAALDGTRDTLRQLKFGVTSQHPALLQCSARYARCSVILQRFLIQASQQG